MFSFARKSDGTYLLMLNSIVHPSMPLRKDTKRQDLFLSGYYAQPQSINTCTVTFVTNSLFGEESETMKKFIRGGYKTRAFHLANSMKEWVEKTTLKQNKKLTDLLDLSVLSPPPRGSLVEVFENAGIPKIRALQYEKLFIAYGLSPFGITDAKLISLGVSMPDRYRILKKTPTKQDKISGIEIETKIGSGAFSIVYKGRPNYLLNSRNVGINSCSSKEVE